MRRAKNYIYRNLHKDCMSVRLRGKVIMYTDAIGLIANDVDFRVLQSGRTRVLESRQKNVHAYVVAEYTVVPTDTTDTSDMVEITYDPYVRGSFYIANTDTTVSGASVAYIVGTKVYCRLNQLVY